MTHHIKHTGIYAKIMNTNDEILLVKKSRGIYTGLLDLPGGSPEDNEALIETLIREVKEETGLDLINPKFLKEFDITYNRDETILKHTGSIYEALLHDTMISIEQIQSEDTDGFLWYPIHAIKKEIVTPTVLSALEKNK